MKYKASMFNCINSYEDGTILFNSFNGLSTALFVNSGIFEKINYVLDNPDCYDNGNLIHNELVKRGFLVEADKDEKSLREYSAQTEINQPKLQLLVATTEGCNFRCKYCSLEGGNKKPMDITVQDRIVEYVRKTIALYTSVQIDWFGGEPLMGMSAIRHISQEVIAICKKAHKQYSASITTNGFLLSDSIVRELIGYKVMSYTITVVPLSA